MTNKDIYKIWAPKGARWVDWVRPVPFIGIGKKAKIYEVGDFSIPNITYINQMQKDMAIIVDLDENNSIKEGLALAKLGYRPIPIYNGTSAQEGAMATVNNDAIQIGLIKGAAKLEKIKIDKNAPPVFLLDSNRMNQYKMNESVFDNSWDIYHQDLPTSEYFLKNGINKILIVGNVFQKDLKKILYKFQKENIKILFTTRQEEIKEVHISRKFAEEII